MSQRIAPGVPPVILRNDTFADLVATLDRIGFDVGHTRISLWSALVVCVVLIAVLFFARFGSVLAKRLFARLTRLDRTQQLLGEKLVSVAVWAFAILIGIDVLGIDLTALAVFSGAFGLAIGFGLQKTFGNLIAGIILLMDRSIKPGDVIMVSDGKISTVGQVNKIGIRAVSVVTRDRTEYLIPNENLMVNQVENWSYSSRDVRIKIPVRVAYGTDIDLAERLMLEAIGASARVLERPEPAVRLTSLGDSGIEFEMRVWIDDPEDGIGNVRSDVLKRLWHLFQEHGVEIPFPQSEIRIKEWPARPERQG